MASELIEYWCLFLSDMRGWHFEHMEPVARGDVAALEALLASETVEGYMDGKWGKGFRKGGPLERYNAVREGSIRRVSFTLPPRVETLTGGTR